MVSSRVGIVEFHAASVAIKIDLCHGSVFECLSYLLDDFLCIHFVCLVVAGWLASRFLLSYDELEVIVSSVVSSISCQIKGFSVCECFVFGILLPCLGVTEGEVHHFVLLASVCVFPFLFVDLVCYVRSFFNLFHALGVCRGVVGSPVSFLFYVAKNEFLVFLRQLQVVMELEAYVSLLSEDCLCGVHQFLVVVVCCLPNECLCQGLVSLSEV